MKMQLTLNIARDGSASSATSQCGRYAWQCKRPLAIKAKSAKPTMLTASDTLR
jgi:hypothetical protein